MKYNELPKWAQKEVFNWAKQQYLDLDEEARESGEDVSEYTDEELEAVALIYCNDKDNYELYYDEDTEKREWEW